MIYKHLSIDCDLCVSALEECLKQGVSDKGEAALHIHPCQKDWVEDMISKLPRYTKTRFPKITVVTDADLRVHEWFLKNGSVAVGSPSS